jgi:4-diphosphocytidyl-2-C-methyl-D-erythritol kinase
MAILIEANAKINLELKILGKRPDGYHDIESVFQSINLSDFLFLEKSEKDEFSGAINCPQEEEIILKAKKILEESIDKKLPCLIHLQKAIPIAAGLGGGSADAAATLLGLNEIYKLNLSEGELLKIAAKIGDDVPFFIIGGTCHSGTFGKDIESIKREVSDYLVVFRPHKRLDTPKMYQLHDETGKSFFDLAKEICPDINVLEEKIKQFSINEFGLSGKGPTIFCGASDYDSAKKVSECYPEFNGDIFICQPTKKAIHIINL